MCPLTRIDRPQFVESAIYVVKTGRRAGEYVASCARDICGYYVFMERIHAGIGVPVKRYPPRDLTDDDPPPVMHISELMEPEAAMDVDPSFPKKSQDVDTSNLQVLPRPARAARTAWDSLMRLDSWDRPGLPDAQFQALFAKCECGLIMTRRTFADHECAVFEEAKIVIDLTEDQ